MIDYQTILTRISQVANTLNGGHIHPSTIEEMRTLVVCYDHLAETCKLVKEAINEQVVSKNDSDKTE